MWDLDDAAAYFKLFSVTIPFAYTWGDRDRDKREDIRKAAAEAFPASIPTARWWAFRLFAKKSGDGWDVDNVPKLVVDAFCGERIDEDRSAFPGVRLYEKDTVAHVRMVQVVGEPASGGDTTCVEVYGAK